MMKICSKCKVEKELNNDNFNSCAKNKDGFDYSCKSCINERRRGINSGIYLVDNSRKWTYEEVEILKKYYPTMSSKAIHEEYLPNRTPSQITDKSIKKLKLKKDKDYSPNWNAEHIQYVKENYTNIDILIDEMAQYVGKSYDCVVAMANKLNMVRPKLEWSDEELELIKLHYPFMSLDEFSEKYILNKTKTQIMVFANKNGIKKDNSFRGVIGVENLKKIKSSNYNKQGMPQLKGEESPLYIERIEVYCSQCNIKIKKRKSDIKNKKNIFCSRKCMGSWMSENNTGENNSNYGNGDAWTEEMRRNKAESSIKSLLKIDNQNTVTKPQRIINELLDEMQIKYINEYDCKYYLLDNYLQDYNLGIEVHGNFFHCNPTMNLKNSREIKIIGKDKAKHTYLKKYIGFETLYLWEKDINENTVLCEKLILKYIENNGVMDNYHSFNYKLNDNCLSLNDEIIPFHY